jgi:hypothetical protein
MWLCLLIFPSYRRPRFLHGNSFWELTLGVKSNAHARATTCSVRIFYFYLFNYSRQHYVLRIRHNSTETSEIKIPDGTISRGTFIEHITHLELSAKVKNWGHNWGRRMWVMDLFIVARHKQCTNKYIFSRHCRYPYLLCPTRKRVTHSTGSIAFL